LAGEVKQITHRERGLSMNAVALLEFVAGVPAKKIDGRVPREDAASHGGSRFLEHRVAVAASVEEIDRPHPVSAVALQRVSPHADVVRPPAPDHELDTRDLGESPLAQPPGDEIEKLP